MDLGYWLHQDFMVDRTEIVFSAAVLDKVAEDIVEGCIPPAQCTSCKRNQQYSLECEIRCFENRLLDQSVHSFIKGIKKGMEDSQGKHELLVSVEIAAGRKDLLLRFFNKNVTLPHTKIWKFDTFRDGLKELLQPVKKDKDGRRYDFVDRIEVNINKQPPDQDED